MGGHIRKRGTEWAVVVDVGHGENGPRNQRRYSAYPKRREAQAALTEILGRSQARRPTSNRASRFTQSGAQ